MSEIKTFRVSTTPGNTSNLEDSVNTWLLSQYYPALSGVSFTAISYQRSIDYTLVLVIDRSQSSTSQRLKVFESTGGDRGSADNMMVAFSVWLSMNNVTLLHGPVLDSYNNSDGSYGFVAVAVYQ